MTATVPSQARQLLDRSRVALTEAAQLSPAARYLKAYDAARESALVVLVTRARPPVDTAASPWARLADVAPELATWSELFQLSAGPGTISQADADDLLRYAEAFHHHIEASLALPYRNVLPGTLPDVTEE